jgi:hypothetical protein
MVNGEKEPISNKPLSVDRSIIIDSVNNNDISWNLQKSIEEAISLADVLLKAKKNVVANEQICAAIADEQIQIAILSELYGASNIQFFINDRLTKIKARNKRLEKEKNRRKVGFTSGMGNNQ